MVHAQAPNSQHGNSFTAHTPYSSMNPLAKQTCSHNMITIVMTWGTSHHACEHPRITGSTKVLYLQICLHACQSIYLCMHPSRYLSIYLPTYLSIYLSIRLFMYLSIYLSIYLSPYPSIHLSFFVSYAASWSAPGNARDKQPERHCSPSAPPFPNDLALVKVGTNIQESTGSGLTLGFAPLFLGSPCPESIGGCRPYRGYIGVPFSRTLYQTCRFEKTGFQSVIPIWGPLKAYRGGLEVVHFGARHFSTTAGGIVWLGHVRFHMCSV